MITSQIALWCSFGTYQQLMLIFWLMSVHWRISIQVVTTVVLGVLYWGTIDSTQPQWLTILEPLLVPGLVLSVMRTVGMNSTQPLTTGSANLMQHGLEFLPYVVWSCNVSICILQSMIVLITWHNKNRVSLLLLLLLVCTRREITFCAKSFLVQLFILTYTNVWNEWLYFLSACPCVLRKFCFALAGSEWSLTTLISVQ